MATRSNKPIDVFGATADAPPVCEDGRHARRGHQHGWHERP